MKAYFVHRPRIISDLKAPHALEAEHEYEIVRTIVLSRLDYENFIWDMLVDREFIGATHQLCSEGNIYRCLLVKSSASSDGILLLPQNPDFVKYAAYYPG